MKKFLAPLLCVATLASASTCDFEVGAAALYWRPMSGTYRYSSLTAVGAPPVDNQKQLSLTPDYDWGFRIWGSYTQCQYTATLDWIRFRSTDAIEVKPPAGMLIDSNEEITAVQARYKTDYDRVNLRGIYTCCPCDCLLLTPYVGVRYINIEKRLSKKIIEPSVGRGFSSSEFTTKFEGGGLEFGSGAEIGLGCGFSLNGWLGGVVAIGSNRAVDKIRTLSGNREVIITKAGSTAACRPGLEWKLELVYDYCICNWLLKGAIGFEYHYYFSLLAPIDRTFRDDSENIGFAGPYISLSIGF